MEMIDDSERREVAARLRSIKGNREGCGHELCCDLWSAIFDSDYRCTDLCDECEVAVLNSLADLIEPSERACYYYDADTNHCRCYDTRMVDRDALLALADELERPMRDCGYSKRIASRIREALGAEGL